MLELSKCLNVNVNTFWQECTIYVKSNVVGGVRNTEGAVILVHIINYETFPVNTCGLFDCFDYKFCSIS